MIALSFRTFLFTFVTVALLTSCGGSSKKRGNGDREEAQAATASVEPAVVSVKSVAPIPETGAAPKSLRAKLYLEASGSMFPYDDPRGKGEFNSAVQQLLTPFETEKPGSTELYAVNNNVYPLGVSFQELIQKPDVFSLARGKGDSKNTDFSLIFKTILSGLREGDVAVLFSDLIYSTPSTSAQSSSKILADVETLMQTTFASHVKGKSLLLLQLESEFKGTYYPYRGAGKAYSGSRPYYIALLATNNTMKALLADSRFGTFRQFEKLPGFESFHYFTSAADNVPFYTVLLKDTDQAGRFEQSHDERKNKGPVHTIENIEADRKTKGLTLVLGVDLGGYYLPEAYKTNPKSYVLESDEGFKIQKIIAEKGPEGYTHKFLLNTLEPQGGGNREITLRLKRRFPPDWITRTTTDDDTNIRSGSFAGSTFGLLNFTRGIEKAYNPKESDTYFTVTVVLQD